VEFLSSVVPVRFANSRSLVIIFITDKIADQNRPSNCYPPTRTPTPPTINSRTRSRLRQSARMIWYASRPRLRAR
jgi:hypothetical protein